MTKSDFNIRRNILVVGGNGFIGRHVCKAFAASGANVTVFDLAPAQSETEYECITGSISDASLLASTIMGKHTVIFLANASLPSSAIANLSTEVQSHVHDTIRAAELCVSLGVERFLFASSGGTVYGHEPAKGEMLHEQSPTLPRNAYAVSKLSNEHYLRLLAEKNSAFSTVSLRISNPYGQGQRAVRGQGFIAAAMKNAFDGTPIEIWGDGGVERDFLHVTDVAHAFLLAEAAQEPPPVVNIGSGQGVSLQEALELVETATSRSIDKVYREGRPIDVRRNVLDCSLARESFGWSPRVGLMQGLEQTAAWWKEITQAR